MNERERVSAFIHVRETTEIAVDTDMSPNTVTLDFGYSHVFLSPERAQELLSKLGAALQDLDPEPISRTISQLLDEQEARAHSRLP